MKRKRLVSIVLTISLLGSALAACTGAALTPTAEKTQPAQVTQTPEVEQQATPEETEATGAPIEIIFWNTLDQAVNPAAHEWRAKALAQFAEEHPEILVKEEITPDKNWDTKITTAVASQTEPDIFYVRGGAWIDPFVQEGVLLPLNEYLEEDGWKDTFTSHLETFNKGGIYYAVPYQTRTVRIFYNKALFEEYGLEPPKTWDEMMTVVKTLKENDIIPFAAGHKQLFYFDWLYMQIHTRLNGYQDMQNFLARDGGPGFTAPSFLEAAQKLQELAQAGAFPEGASGLDFMEASTLFWNDAAAMTSFMDIFWGMTAGNAPDVKMEYFDFPVFEGVTKEPDALVGGVNTGIAISSRTKNPEAAIEFLKFWTRADVARELSASTGWVLGIKNTIPTEASDFTKRIVESTTKAPYINYFYKDIMPAQIGQEVYANGLAGLVDGTMTPEQFVQSVEDAAKQFYGK